MHSEMDFIKFYGDLYLKFRKAVSSDVARLTILICDIFKKSLQLKKIMEIFCEK